jgi:ribosomal protein S18 acetylase RimI-like enzyme
MKNKNQSQGEIPDNITINDASEADLPFIGVLILELAESLDDCEPANLEKTRQSFIHLLRKPDSRILVARLGRKVVGFIHLTIRQTLFHPEPSCLIEELIVTKSHRGQGVGSVLVSEAIKKCQQMGCGEIEVSTAKLNMKARDFYKYCGLYECGIVFGKHW